MNNSSRDPRMQYRERGPRQVYRNAVRMERIRRSTSTSRASRRKASSQVQHYQDHINTPTIQLSRTNYLTSGESECIDITSYQCLVGDIIYLSLTNTAIPYANSAVAQKTQYCTQCDYDAAIHILCYINGHKKQGLIFHRAPEWQRPLRLTDVLDISIPIYFSCDGAHNAMTELLNSQDQSGYYIKLYSWYTASVECISTAQRITLSSTEAEVAYMVLTLRSSLDIHFILNAIGFKTICRIIAQCVDTNHCNI